MKQCVLHIGLHKTGSTFLQNTWRGGAVELVRHGVLYPVDVPGLRSRSAHNGLASHLSSLGVDAFAHDEFASLDALIGSRPAEETLLLSSETFANSLNKPRVLAALCDWLLARFAKVHVIAFVRPQYELVNSRYAQSVRMLKLDTDFSSFLSDHPRSKHQLDFRRAFQPLAQQVARAPDRIQLSVLVHTPECLMTLFMQTAGLAAPARSEKIVNQSPGPLTLLLARGVRRALLAEGFSSPTVWRSEAFREFIRAIVNEGGRHGWNDEGFRGFHPSTADAFMERYRSANSIFVEDFAVPNAAALGRISKKDANSRSFENLSPEETALLDAAVNNCLKLAPRQVLQDAQ